MAGIGQQGVVVWEEPLLSAENLSSFLAWSANSQTTDEELKAVEKNLFILEHRSIFGEERDEDLAGLQLPRPDGSSVWIKGKLCRDPGCVRCSTQAGGYKFCWVSPKWTPALCRPDPNISPSEAKWRCRQAAWPQGIGR